MFVDATVLAVTAGIPFALGFFTGLLARALSKLILILFAAEALFLAYLSYTGVITVNWNAFMNLVDTTLRNVYTFLSQFALPTATFGIGFFTGLFVRLKVTAGKRRVRYL